MTLMADVEALHERVVAMEERFEGCPVSLRTLFERLVDVEKAVYKSDARQPSAFAEPSVGYEDGLKQLIVHGRCPWCGQAIADVTYGIGLGFMLTWNCDKGCNP